MPQQRLQTIPLDTVVTDYLDQSEQGINKYNKIWNIAFRGMEQLGLDFFYRIKTVKLPVTATKTVSIPDDCLQYTKIGILNSNGEIIPLKYNQKLTNLANLMPNRSEIVEDSQVNYFGMYSSANPMFWNFQSSGFVSNLYGIPFGGSGVGQFNIDMVNGVIALNPDFHHDYLIVEYVSSPNPIQGQDYFLPVQFREAMVAWIAWQDIAALPSTRRGYISDKQERKTNFYNERRLANARFKPYYKEHAYDLNLESQRLTVKA